MLNSTALRGLWSELDEYERELNEDARGLEQAWTALCELDSENDAAYEVVAAAPELSFLPADTLLRIDVGGQVFTLTVELLTKDPFSLLASCCRVHPPFELEGEERVVHFDRDWWLFRHIVSFLRTGLLPNELDTLTELYAEGAFYRLSSLQRAIEDVPVAKLQPKLPLEMDRLNR